MYSMYFFVALVLVRFVIDRKKTYFPLVFTIFSWSAVILWVIALTIFSPDKIQAIMGGRSYILFPAVFIALVILKVSYPQSLNIEKNSLLHNFSNVYGCDNIYY
ncbi:O-antigen polymerase [Salmonella enterica]|uniref:O-antigen polymerase n=1 Tax=Salmonella enterica TaxID=28901 RepID=A0A7D8ENH3_SALER|nr:O-antigen polymerase [Salmonella enterica]